MDLTRARRIDEVTWELGTEYAPGMIVPVRFLADELLVGQIGTDRSLEQLINVAMLPGITRFAIGMPDLHEGYGFPVGGVAATLTPDGAISPGGIGFDINCGVRLLATNLELARITPWLETFVHELSRAIPTGYGRHGRLVLERHQLERVLLEGAGYVVRELGLGVPADLTRCEGSGQLPDAEPAGVSARARERGEDQLGTLGGGNHFIEVQRVVQLYDEPAARAFGLFKGQLTVLIHTGSRGLGHQVCLDHLGVMDRVSGSYGFTPPDRQLACVPFGSPEGRSYFGAMCAAANFAFANRQLLTHRVRQVLGRILGPHFPHPVASTVYDVAHNTAKLESHGGRLVCVHRKGATRALGPSGFELPDVYRGVGQPVFIPGSMGTASYVLVGTDESAELSFSSCCHGAGRALSRTAAKHQVQGHVLRKELEARGIVVRCPSNLELAEEAPAAYKDIDRVVEVVARAGIARKVARLEPVGVLKG